ncbi:leader peptidase (prepilin peptidase) / N-methyltransferase [Lentibacillus halodurans]|uniref:Leader peptidase (Prepilin peptidase) / N-methyltransferase n=1 Tax=Lentibacillus halodurans TaxID=237679 RepID=A0A1I0ZGV7_9BACI|nr:A24 family peptidase [Lentibacillus halodurans]SFB25009.1 leader peptidase (prepilin peptidase) / N-methyltransferase [Lentibacillus halodurans]
MDNLLILLFFLLGLIFGSFFNVIGLRIPQKKSFTNDRSVCPQCQHPLSWPELIPVLSYMMQRGKCRHCNGSISLLYPVIELTTGVLFVFCYIQSGLDFELITALILMSLLVIILVSDIRYMLIPNSILLFFFPLLVLARFIRPLDTWWSSIAGAFAGVLIIAIVILVSRGGMGAGDMKLFGLLGIVLGFEKTLLALFLSCMIGAVIGLVLLLLKVIDRQQPVPFGPYIVIASIITYFHGDILLGWYFHDWLQG